MPSRSRIRRRRSIVKVAFAIVVFLLLLLAAAVGALWVLPLPFYHDVEAVDPGVVGDAAQIARGKRLVSLACAGCHGSAEETFLVGRAMTEMPKVWGAVSAPNLTRHKTSGIGNVSDAYLARAIRSGVGHEGMFLVPVMPRYAGLADEDVAAIIAYLRSEDPPVGANAARPSGGEPSLRVKMRAQFTWRPLPPPSEPIPRPSDQDPYALGKYLVDEVLKCNICHGTNEDSIPLADPTMDAHYLGGGMRMFDLNDKPISAANLTPDEERGLGKWTYEQFRTALVDGRTIDDRQLRWPMRRYWQLEEAEVMAIWQYLRTVEPQQIEPAEPTAYRVPGQRLDMGRHLFFKHECFVCHGDKTPHGILVEASKHFDTNEKLALYIAEPTAGNGVGPMPGFARRMTDDELLSLAAYVRSLSSARPNR